ncbi:beta-glucosidase [Malassezia yamatoensis]|uniref:Beta-glucosidase n=1 Tax=Malassezia yamatoensis TaxID=253288 RepID=A0AAJ5YZE6_9BASI|nr:beta-glucosidase [Malassezia yamatoensis]
MASGFHGKTQGRSSSVISSKDDGQDTGALNQPRAQLDKKSAKIHTVIDTPYFTPAQIEKLMARTRMNKMPAAKWEQIKMAACSYIMAVGSKLGIPQRTVASAQLLYQRFHLFYPPSDFAMHQVALASLFTASKLNDTQKRMDEYLFAGYMFRYPELLTPPSAGSSNGVDWVAHAKLSDADVDHETMAQEKLRLLTLERMLLQCLCFQLGMRAGNVLRLVVKVARSWGMPSSLAISAWRAACDSHRTCSPLIYPPQTVAIGSLYAACLLSATENDSQEILDKFAEEQSTWASELHACMDDVKDVAMQILSMYQAYLPHLESHGSHPIPPYVSYPPPMGLIAWYNTRCKAALPVTTAELEHALTQTKIRLRQDEEARKQPENLRRKYAVKRAMDSLPTTMYRADPLEQQMVATRYLLE